MKHYPAPYIATREKNNNGLTQQEIVALCGELALGETFWLVNPLSRNTQAALKKAYPDKLFRCVKGPLNEITGLWYVRIK